MKQTWKTVGLLAGIFFLAVATQGLRASGQARPTATSSGDSRDQRALAVSMVRLINTAEAVCQDENHKFLSWDTLLNAPCFKKAQSLARFPAAHEPSYSPGSEVVPGLELRLVESADGRHYNLWLGEKGNDCGLAFYSDERGLIYEGTALGCERRQADQVHYRITMVIVRGNRRVQSSAVRNSISIHPGDIYDSAKIGSDVAALKKTGYFDDVRAETKDDEWTKNGKVVTFYVREKKDLILPHAPSDQVPQR